jgi:hypothetical protein
MQIPFGQFGRRPGAPDLDEALEGGPVDAVDAPERPSDEPKLALQRMENRLVRYDLVAPEVLSSEDLRRLAIQLQMVRNAPYADHLVRFEPTLSPVNLTPSVAAIDRACEWGARSVEKAIPVISALLEPTWCEGDGPAVPGEEPEARGKSVASPMSAVMAAIQLPQNRFTRWRRRHLI